MAYIYDLADVWAASGTTFTGIKLNVTNTASAATSMLMDLQVGGSSLFSVGKNGYLGILSAPSGSYLLLAGGPIGASQYACTSSTGGFYWDAANSPGLFRDGNNSIAQRNGVNAQAFNLYNTYTDASNYERGFMRFVSNVLQIGSEKLGTGTARALAFQTDGAIRLNIGASGISHVYGRLSVVPSGTATGGAAGDLLVGRSGSEAAISFGTDNAAQIYRVDSTRTEFGFPGRISLNSGSSMVCLNGVTSSFPALKRSTTSLQARLADDSAFTNIQGKLTTDTNYTAGVTTPTGYIVLFDGNGTAYKVPAEAL